MIVKDVIDFFDSYSPLSYAEDFDNIGLLVGNMNDNVTGILICLDSTEDIILEATNLNYNLVVSFHPIIFEGLKNLSEKNHVNNSVVLAIKNKINIISVHTALDNSNVGVNMKLSQMLGLNNTKILCPKKHTIKKLTTYIPKEYSEKLKERFFSSGAGKIGKYENCSFSFEGLGTFKGNEKSKPYMGKKLENVEQSEECVNITYLKHLENDILKVLNEIHPYEEIAYEIKTLENINENIGMGMFGFLKNEMLEKDFLDLLKDKLSLRFLKHSDFLNKKIKKVAVLGGSGSFAIEDAISIGADAYVTSDIKYHDYFKANKSILLIDVGHYESEQFTKNLMFDILTKKFPNFAIALTKKNSNPVNYY